MSAEPRHMGCLMNLLHVFNFVADLTSEDPTRRRLAQVYLVVMVVLVLGAVIAVVWGVGNR